MNSMNDREKWTLCERPNLWAGESSGGPAKGLQIAYTLTNEDNSDEDGNDKDKP